MPPGGTERSLWRDSMAVGVTAFLIRLAHLLTMIRLPTFDSYVMDEAYQVNWAQRLASGNWIGDEVFFRAPLHAYLLGLVFTVFGEGGLAPRLIQITIGAVGVVLLHRIGLRLTDRWTALIASLLMAFCWPLVYIDNELLIAVLEVTLSLSVVLLLLRADAAGRASFFLAAGVTLGLAAIARPNMLAFAPAAAGWIALSPTVRRRAAILAFTGGLLIPILPVTARNLVVGGDFVLISSQGGVNFYIGNNPLADGTTAVVPGTRPTWEGGYEDTIERARRDTGLDLKPSGVSRYWFRQGMTFWRDEPLSALALLAKKFYLFMSGLEISNNKDIPFFRSLSPVLSLPLPSTAILAPLGLVGWGMAWRDHRKRRRLLSLPLLFAATYGLSVIVFFVTSRYRMPVLPVWALGAGFFVDGVHRRIRGKQWSTLTVTGLLVLILIVALNINPTGYRADPAQGHLTLGLSHALADEPEEAIASFDRAIEMGGPYLYEALHRKGEVLLASGRREEAVDALKASLRITPGNPQVLALLLGTSVALGRYDTARDFVLTLESDDPVLAAVLHFTVGSMDQRMGNYPDAEGSYQASLEHDPAHLGSLVNLALLLRTVGRSQESLDVLLRAVQEHPHEPIVHLNLAKHYLFVGDTPRAREHAAEAERLGGAIDEGFRRALESAQGQTE